MSACAAMPLTALGAAVERFNVAFNYSIALPVPRTFFFVMVEVAHLRGRRDIGQELLAAIREVPE
jgi:hypothetical protein